MQNLPLRSPPGNAAQRKRLFHKMSKDEAKAELERIATEAPYERDRIAAIRLLKEMWEEEAVDPQTRVAELLAQVAEGRQ